MADDFWGEWQWESFHREIQRVLPGREFVELPMDDAIFTAIPQAEGFLREKNVGFRLAPCDGQEHEKENQQPKANEV